MKTIYMLSFLLLVTAQRGRADLLLTLDPIDGVVHGAPGDTVGWGFTFTTDDSNYYVLNLSDLCLGVQSSPCANSLGDYTDYAAAINGLIIGPSELPSGYSEVFDSVVQTGVGGLTLHSGLSPQSLDAILYVNFDIYDDDPLTGAGTLLGSGAVSAPVQIVVDAGTTVVPEPSAFVLLIPILGTLMGWQSGLWRSWKRGLQSADRFWQIGRRF